MSLTGSMITCLHPKYQVFREAKPMVGMTKSILDGSSRDTGEITMSIQPAGPQSQ